MTTAFYAASQVPEDARRLLAAGVGASGLDRPIRKRLRPGRGVPAALLLAREWGLADLEERLVEAIELSWEPTWHRYAQGEFTWGLGLDEEHPRGQFNAFLAAAEAAGPGRWAQLSGQRLERCPQVVGVDFPSVALRRAEWRGSTLHLSVAVHDPDPTASTSFRVEGATARDWRITGPPSVSVDGHESGALVQLPMQDCEFQLHAV